MATRHVSASSNLSSESTGNLLISRSAVQRPNSSKDEVLRYAIRVLLIEYINEPRFKKRVVRPQENVARASAKQKANKRASWLFSDSPGPKNNSSGEAKQLQKLIPALENYLKMVAIDKVKLKRALLRRSLLKLYNDAFLDPTAAKQTSSINRLEELIMLFTKAANGELAKVGNMTGAKDELYSQVCCFLDTLARLAAEQEPQRLQLASRIKEYKTQFSRSDVSSPSLSPISSITSETDVTEFVTKPSFKISDIAHSSYLMKIFDLSDIEFQQILIKYVGDTDNAALASSLNSFKTDVLAKKPETAGPEYEFASAEMFLNWKKVELRELDHLITKLRPSSATIGDKTDSSLNIPEHPRDVYTELARLILVEELSTASSYSLLSKDASFFLTKCATYWRVDYPSTKATLLYRAFNISVLDSHSLDTQRFDLLTKFIKNKVFTSEEDFLARTCWRRIDQEQWHANITYTFEQCMNSIKLLLVDIFEKPRPKFSALLETYYTHIEPELILQDADFSQKNLYRKHLRRMRRVLFKSSEHFYVSLVQTLSREKAIEFHDVKSIADRILSEIQGLQKRYAKPLLDEINLTFECSKVLIEAFGVDCSAMLAQVERSIDFENSRSIPIYDATETYKSLRELADIYAQVEPSKSFPFKLERYFIKYLSELCDEACSSTLGVIQTALEKETWEPIEYSTGYSTSVVDVFKMIHESFDLFLKLNWGNGYQISKIYTFLLKAVADGLSLYASNVAKLIEDEVKSTQSEETEAESYGNENKRLSILSQTAAAKMKKTWLYGEMKNALKSNEISIPKPFKFQNKTCVCLSNLDRMMQMVTELEERVNPDEVSKAVNKHEISNAKSRKKAEMQNRGLRHIYTVKVIRAENIRVAANDNNTLSSISIIDTNNRREFATTREVLKVTRPIWNEEFEIEIPMDDVRPFNFILWHHKQSFNSVNSKVYGRSFLYLNPHKMRDDGYPQDISLNLDTTGQVLLQVSVETEKVDALFSMGRAYRSLNRALDRSIELIVSKFQVFVHFAFSKATLRAVCGPNGQIRADKTAVYDSILPLFDYLNANLDILATRLPRELLHKIMLEAWDEILIQADDLLLPLSSDAPKLRNRNIKNKSLWENAVGAAKLGISSNSSSERPLTQIEIDTIFDWLRALCIDFFHNNGEGPSLSDLKNAHYQKLLLVPVFYDRTVHELMSEVDRLNKEYRDSMFAQNKTSTKGSTETNLIKRRVNTIARRKTIIANSSRKRRMELDKEIKAAEENPIENIISTQDVLLRILMAKGETEFVAESLLFRETISKTLYTESIVQAARSSRH